MNTLDIILLILVIALCLKWIAMALLLITYVLRTYGLRRCGTTGKVLCLPARVVEHFLHMGGERWFLYHVSLFPSIRLRKLIYRSLGAKIAEKVNIHFRTEMREPGKLTIGKGSIVGDNAILDARRGLTIGCNVCISSNVSIYTLQHDYRDPYFGDPKGRKLSVEIGDRSWLGSNVIVLPGVVIGEGAVCCAGCVVCKDVPPYTVVAGIPAHKVAERPTNLKYEFSGYTVRLF